jgi:hypothetical protein
MLFIFNTHKGLRDIAENVLTRYSTGQSIYQEYFDSHFI